MHVACIAMVYGYGYGSFDGQGGKSSGSTAQITNVADLSRKSPTSMPDADLDFAVRVTYLGDKLEEALAKTRQGRGLKMRQDRSLLDAVLDKPTKSPLKRPREHRRCKQGAARVAQAPDDVPAGGTPANWTMRLRATAETLGRLFWNGTPPDCMLARTACGATDEELVRDLAEQLARPSTDSAPADDELFVPVSNSESSGDDTDGGLPEFQEMAAWFRGVRRPGPFWH